MALPCSPLRLPVRFAIAGFVALAAACNDSTGPQARLSDPQGLSSDLQAVDGAFQSSTFQSFSALSFAPGSPVAAPSRMGALLAAAPIVPPRARTQPYASAPARLQALRLAASVLSSGISANVIPPTMYGQTWVWDEGTHQYILSPDPGPNNGIRIILYAIDPITGQIVEPPVAVGYVEFLDWSTPSTDSLQVILRGGTPSVPGTTYADYAVSATVTGDPPTAFSATAGGFVSDGTRTLTFGATFAVTQVDTDNPDTQIDVMWDIDNPVIHVELHETLAQSDADHLALTLTEFSITRGAETVSMHGTITSVLSTEAFSINLVVDVNDVPWIRIRGTQNGATVRHPNGSDLSPEEGQAFLDLFFLSATIEFAVLNLFTPAGSFMGA